WLRPSPPRRPARAPRPRARDPRTVSVGAPRSVEPREPREVARALLEEGVTALLRLVRHVGEARGLAREQLLSHQAVVDEIEGVLEHADGRRALGVDLARPLERHLLELG